MIQACNGTIVPVKGNLIFGLMGLLGSTPPANAGPVRIASITDGTSNTALFSEHLVAMGNGVFAPPDPSVSPGSPNGKRGIFQTSVTVVLDQGSAANAQAFVAACKSVPAGTLAVTDDAFGAQWLLSMDYAVANNGYTHVMTPNGISCIGTSGLRHLRRELGRGRRGDHGDQQSPRRRQRRLRRRLGQVHQGLDQPPDLVGPRLAQRRRGDQCRSVLTRMRPADGLACHLMPEIVHGDRP